MDIHISALKIRYEAVLQSSSDPLFYKNVHRYIDYIVKTPELAKVINKSENEYNKKHREIWSIRKDNDEEIDDQADFTDKLESFSLYASDYAFLYVRIYFPIEDYLITNDPDHRQDPVALLMLKGIKNILSKNWDKRKSEAISRWSKKRLEMYNRWFEGKRMSYQNHLQQFHFEFLSVINDLRLKTENTILVQEQENTTIPISFNERTGDFSYLKTKGNFSPISPEFKVFNLLLHSKDYFTEYLPLLKAILPHAETVTKVNKANLHIIIRNIKEKLYILPESKTSNYDLIKNIPKLGYRLIFEAGKEIPE